MKLLEPFDHPDLPDHEYSWKIEWLFMIYEKMNTALEKEERELEEALKDISQRIELAGDEYEAYGRLSSQEAEYTENINLCIDTRTTTNNTTVINFFHFWEKHWFNVIKGAELKHDATDKEIKDFNYKDFETFKGIKKRIEKYRPIDEKVSLVNNIVNVLKHANRRKIRKLQKERPDLFPISNDENKINMDFLTDIAGADALCLKPAHVKEVFIILAQAGPDSSIFYARNKDVKPTDTYP
ncbi:hypothetical protein [Acetobacter sp. UBA5411]|uniref:hypothetical protein n=1 Tax=Acetobacter sp. UBA5411 TaxID=1945905 RepID=UPI0025C25D58|nr:hypothetical protein [Acetobacter sp. UBA5411]